MKFNNRFNMNGLFRVASLVYLLGLLEAGLNLLASYPPPVNRGVTYSCYTANIQHYT